MIITFLKSFATNYKRPSRSSAFIKIFTTKPTSFFNSLLLYSSQKVSTSIQYAVCNSRTQTTLLYTFNKPLSGSDCTNTCKCKANTIPLVTKWTLPRPISPTSIDSTSKLFSNGTRALALEQNKTLESFKLVVLQCAVKYIATNENATYQGSFIANTRLSQ